MIVSMVHPGMTIPTDLPTTHKLQLEPLTIHPHPLMDPPNPTITEIPLIMHLHHIWIIPQLLLHTWNPCTTRTMTPQDHHSAKLASHHPYSLNSSACSFSSSRGLEPFGSWTCFLCMHTTCIHQTNPPTKVQNFQHTLAQYIRILFNNPHLDPTCFESETRGTW